MNRWIPLLAAGCGLIGGLAGSVLISHADRDGNGTYTLASGNPVVPGTTISTTWANNTLSDIATALTNSLAKDGQTNPTADLPMATYKHTGVGNADARNQYGTVDQVQDGDYLYVGSVSGTDTVTGSLSPAIGAYVAGQTFVLTPANNNTGATTLNLNSVGAIDVLKMDGDALAAGDLLDGIPALLLVDEGADDFILLNPQALVSQANTNGVFGQTIDNDSNGTANAARLNVISGDGSVALFAAGTGRTSAIITGGPTGAQGVLRTLGSDPLVFGTSNTQRMLIAGDGSEIDLSATLLDFNGVVDLDGNFDADGTSIDLDGSNDLGLHGGSADIALSGTEADITATTLDLNGNLDADGTTLDIDGATSLGLHGGSADITLSGTEADVTAATMDFNGNIDADGTTFTWNGNNVATETTSTFSGNFTVGCTTTPSGNYSYTKIGNIVALQLEGEVTCTGDSTGMILDASSLPAAIRPVDIQHGSFAYSVDAGSTVSAIEAEVQTDGSIQYWPQGGTWTASGARTLAEHTIVYHLN